jgi:1,5-anhydro-D-fructose reductase (1,5-anhydro-D-mannitol-forming)
MAYRVGIIGLGIMGQRMLSNMSRHDAFEVVAVFDPHQTSPDLAHTNSAESLIAHPDVDLVYIACPPEYHAGYAIAAAEVGKPVFCEKPLGIDVQQSQELVETIENMGARNVVNFSFAASPTRERLTLSTSAYISQNGHATGKKQQRGSANGDKAAMCAKYCRISSI